MVKYDTSYGVIPLRKINQKWQVLLVFHAKGFWAFPKGHAEKGESPQEAAARELFEETRLSVIHFLSLPNLEEEYFFREGSQFIHKQVTYWIAEVVGEVSIQLEELIDYRWVSLQEATHLATFPEMKAICDQLFLYEPLMRESFSE